MRCGSNASSLDLKLVAGRTVIVPLVSASCGVMGQRMRLECPTVCSSRLRALLSPTAELACRRCNGLWYAAQRTSSYGRKALAKRKVRRKLGDYGQLWAANVPAKTARHVAADVRSSLCGAGTYRAQAILTRGVGRMSANAPQPRPCRSAPWIAFAVLAC